MPGNTLLVILELVGVEEVVVAVECDHEDALDVVPRTAPSHAVGRTGAGALVP